MSVRDVEGRGARSPLNGALARMGAAMGYVSDVEGTLVISHATPDGARVFGILSTHDAKVPVGFERSRVSLPDRPGRVILSGKPWIDVQGGQMTVMVSSYRFT